MNDVVQGSVTYVDDDLRIGVDIGGTFTDLCAMNSHGIIAVGKTLTTHQEPARGVEELTSSILKSAGLDAGDVKKFVHGTTLITNALIERKGSRTALLTTAGFRDILELRREHRYELYDLMLELPVPLVRRWSRFDVPERIYADGTVATPIDLEFVERLAGELREADIEAVAIAFLHSYKNPAHERAAREVIRRVAPDLRVAISCEVVPEIREYERTSTTVANVYVQKIAEDYLGDLRGRIARLGIEAAPQIMLSNGGVATVDTASKFPIRMLESGPAGGALAAAIFGKTLGQRDLLAFDMGGTTAKLCMIEDGDPLVTHQFEVDRMYRMRAGSGLPVKVPVIDMIEIGVGGGSIARIDALGLLTVGPDSAGSEPGPACYARGGDMATVTDADLVLGYLSPDFFLGGEMALDREGAIEAIEKKIAAPLGMTAAQAAYGIHTSVNEDMANAARVHAVERGKNPAGLPLFTFGGAGPVHGVGVARALGASRVIAPPAAGVMSAVGFLTAPLTFDFVRSVHAIVDELDSDMLEGLFSDMEAEGVAILAESGVGPEEITHSRFAEMRYEGQGFEVRVSLPEGSPDWRAELTARFVRQYERLYKRSGPEVPLEVLSWRLVSSGPVPDIDLRQHRQNTAEDSGRAQKGTRMAYFPEAGGYVETAVFDRYALGPGQHVDGPAIIEERESTLVLPPNWRCTVELDGTLVANAADHLLPAGQSAEITFEEQR